MSYSSAILIDQQGSVISSIGMGLENEMKVRIETRDGYISKLWNPAEHV